LTIKDIAKIANVSIATVSMVVNKKDERISEETRQRVLTVIQENNYVPDRIASSMITKTTKSLGLILPDITNPFFPELARGVEDFANEQGWNVILCNSDNKIGKEESYIEMLQEKKVDGIILASSGQHHSTSSVLKKRRIPVVAVDRDIEELPYTGKVMVNNEKGAYEAVCYMISRGYKKIYHITGPLETHTAACRYKGYLRALSENEIIPPAEHMMEGMYSSDWGYLAASNLIDKALEIDGIFCGDDMIALGAIKAMNEKNVSIPEKVGIVGFDDIYLSKYITPELTTVHQPIYELGYKACGLIIKMIQNKPDGNAAGAVSWPKELSLDTTLKRRKTTK
jgi:LacI family transcriptional regulator